MTAEKDLRTGLLDLRSTLALLAVAFLGCCAQSGYSAPALIGMLLALGAALAACAFRTPRPFRVPAVVGAGALLVSFLALALAVLHHPHHVPKASWPGLVVGMLAVAGGLAWGAARPRSAAVGLLAAVALLLSGQAVLRGGVMLEEVKAAAVAVQLTAGAGFALVAVALCLDLRAPGGMGRAFWPRLGLLFLTGALLRVAAVVATPDPLIDVYSWLENAPRHVLRGENPYAVEYPNPYATDRAVRYGLTTEARAAAEPRQRAYATYPPLPIVLTLPCAAAGVDVRYANVACDLLAAAVLFLAAWRRGAPLVGALACGIYLHLPGTPLMMENAWYEPMLAAALGGGLLLVERGNRWGRLLLGLGLAGKQFGVALLPALAATHRKQAWRLLAWCALAGALLILPFFLWGPREFLDVVLFMHLVPPDLNSLTLRSAAHHLFGGDVPGPILAGVAAVVIGWVSWRGREEGSGSALWLGTSLLIFCLCFVKGYYNYFYLCEYLLLLGAASLAASAASGAGAAPVPAGRDAPPALAA